MILSESAREFQFAGEWPCFLLYCGREKGLPARKTGGRYKIHHGRVKRWGGIRIPHDNSPVTETAGALRWAMEMHWLPMVRKFPGRRNAPACFSDLRIIQHAQRIRWGALES